jgi:PAS domain S-box-containing protein
MDRRPKILVVDDDPDNVDVLESLLNTEYDIITALSGYDAIEIFREQLPDLILLDVVMAGLNGFDVCRAIKSIPAHCDMPVIFMTGVNDGSVETLALELGGIDYITKPLVYDLLMLRVRNHIALKKQSDLVKSQCEQLTLQKEELSQLLAEQKLMIKQQHETEIALKVSEERFRMAVAATHAMVYDLDMLTQRVQAMDGLRELLGYENSEAELSLEWWDKQIHPDDLDGCRTAFQCMQSEGDGHSLEYRLRHKDGRTIVVEDHAISMRDSNGKLVRIVGTVIDITKRKSAEEELSQKHLILQTVLENTTDYIYMKDLSGRYVVINSAAANAIEKSVSEIIGNNDYAIFPVEVAREITEADCCLIADEKPLRFEETLFLGGKVRNVFTAKNVCRDSLGNVIGLVGITRDVTEEKEVEKALHESEHKYRTIFDVESDALILVDCETFRFIDVNLAATKMYGYSKEKFLQLTVMDISSEKELTENALSSKILHVPLRWHRKIDGETFPVEITGNYFCLNDRLTHVAAIRDISARRNIEESSQRSAAMLEAIGTSTPDAIYVYDFTTVR